MIPDGSGTFTRYMGMLVNKPKQGLVMRSWRYMAVINDGVVEIFNEEPGINNFWMMMTLMLFLILKQC